MDNPFPFFYYDILSRIVPGAATLAVVWPTKGLPPVDWLLWFVSNGEKEGWEKLAVPIILLGLSYVIGVVYEVLDYFPDISWFSGMKWVSEEIDNKAFLWCAGKYGDDSEKALRIKPKAKRDALMKYRNDNWNRLTYKGGSDPEFTPVFAHCHRFQAEQKMFLHLIYPALIFEILSVVRWFQDGQGIKHWLLDDQGMIGLIALLLFFICCRSRCRRKWMQILAFTKILEAENKRTADSSAVPPIAP